MLNILLVPTLWSMILREINICALANVYSYPQPSTQENKLQSTINRLLMDLQGPAQAGVCSSCTSEKNSRDSISLHTYWNTMVNFEEQPGSGS